MALAHNSAEYARKRVTKLTARIEEMTAIIRNFGSRPITHDERQHMADALRRRRLDVITLKRWQKVLAEAQHD